MKNLFKILLAISLVISTANLHAEEPRQTPVSIEFSARKVELSSDDTKAIIESAHEIIEGDESGGFFKRWRNAFDFKTRFIDAYRWASASGEDKVRNLILDSLVLFGISHTTEMASGPILLAIGSSQHWPEWVMGLVAGGGVTISIPGLDPLCIVIFATYSKSPGFRTGVGFARAVIVHGIKGSLTATGASEVLKKAFARRELKPWLEDLPGLARMDLLEDGSALFYYQLDGGAEAVIRLRGEKASLHSFSASPAFSFEPEEVRGFMKKIGWNARNFARQVTSGEKSAALAEKPYVLSSSHVDDRRSFVLKENAIQVRSPRLGLFARRQADCEDRVL